MPAESPASVPGGGHPRATLLCRPNSHPFQDRNLILDQEVKIGRSVARAKPLASNAIFDCKVLSRNHAVLWYSLGKFYLQDTKSSNGTFVNNQRLSKGAEESSPREVCSGDILQFGVDVMENSRKVTHGCIIATLKLFLPDGKEAKASPSIVNAPANSSIPAQDLYQLNNYIQESLAREQLLENKLITLQKLVQETETASKISWKALMDEDRLLTRLEILESQLATYGKNMGEDRLREETKRLMEEKESYQIAAKETLKKLVDDKLFALTKLKESETCLTNLEQEFASLRNLYTKVIEENSKLSEKITSLSEELSKKQKKELESELSEKKKELYIENSIPDLLENGESGLHHGEEEEEEDEREDINGGGDLEEEEEEEVASRLQQTAIMQASTDSLDGSKPEETDRLGYEQLATEADRLRALVEELTLSRERNESELLNLRLNLDEARSDNCVVLQDLNNTKNKLESAMQLLDSQAVRIDEMEGLLSQRSDSTSNCSASQLSEPDSSEPVKAAAGGQTERSQRLEEELELVGLQLEALAQENAWLKEQLANKSEVDTAEKTVSLAEQPSVAVEAASGKIEDRLGEKLESMSEDRLEASPDAKPGNDTRGENSLEDKLDTSLEANTQDNRPEDSMVNVSCSSCSDLSQVELALAEAEGKIAQLLRVRERLVAVEAEKSNLELDLSEMQEDIHSIFLTSRCVTLCTLIPVLVMLLAIVVAYLPYLSFLMATTDPPSL